MSGFFWVKKKKACLYLTKFKQAARGNIYIIEQKTKRTIPPTPKYLSESFIFETPFSVLLSSNSIPPWIDHILPQFFPSKTQKINTKMRWKRIYSKAALTTFSLAAIMATFFFFFMGSIDIRPRFSSFFQPDPSEPPPCLPLRVYMYDLPPKFNVGMLGSRSSDDAPVTAETLPPWSTKAGLRKQHSAEYWMMAYLLYEGREREKMKLEAIRVSDPEIADVFFVPFFSSLSLSTHGRNMTDPKTEGDKQLQVITKYQLVGWFLVQISSLFIFGF